MDVQGYTGKVDHKDKQKSSKDLIHAAATRAIDIVTKKGSTSISRDAASCLKEMSDEDIDLYRALTDRYIHQSCSHEINAIIRKTNGASWHAKETKTTNRIGEAVARAKETAKRTLMDLVLPGGTLLRNATMADVLDAEQTYMTQGRTMIERGTFMRFVRETMVARQAKDDARVAAVLTAAELDKIDVMSKQEIAEVFDA